MRATVPSLLSRADEGGCAVPRAKMAGTRFAHCPLYALSTMRRRETNPAARSQVGWLRAAGRDPCCCSLSAARTGSKNFSGAGPEVTTHRRLRCASYDASANEASLTLMVASLADFVAVTIWVILLLISCTPAA